MCSELHIPMKIIFVTHWRFPSEKTMTPLVLKTCAQFVRLGYTVELWVPRRHNDYHAGEDVFALYHIEPRFTIRMIPALDSMRFLGALGFVLMVASFNFFCYLRLGREKNAILYAHDVRDVLVPSRRRMPLFVEIHDFFESSLTFVNRMVFKRASGLIVTNSIKLEYIAKKYNYPRERMLRQPNAVEAKDFALTLSTQEAREKLALPQEIKIALYTGHLFSWKGVRTLAEAAAFLPEDMAIYFVGGTVEDRKTMEEYVAAEHLPRITFVPHQTPDKIPVWLRAADVLVLPNTAKDEASRTETSPVKLFEYLASGGAIVASDLPSIRDIVSEREVFFAEPDDPRSFAEAIVYAAAHGSEKSAAAQELGAQHTWEARAKAIVALIDRFS